MTLSEKSTLFGQLMMLVGQFGADILDRQGGQKMAEDKAGFVQELGELIANYAEDRTGVTAMEYLEDADGFEAVTIYFAGGDEDTVNVTGDSCMGIMADIAQRLL